MTENTVKPGADYAPVLTLFLEELNGVLEAQGMNKRNRAFIMKSTLDGIRYTLDRRLAETVNRKQSAPPMLVGLEEDAR